MLLFCCLLAASALQVTFSVCLPVCLPSCPHHINRTHTQVHDELLFEVESSRVAAAAGLIRGVMEDAAAVWGLRVSLPVKVSVGPSWGQLSEYGEQQHQ